MKITFSDKEDIVGLPEVNIKNKVTAADINEIKAVVNANADKAEEVQETVEKSNVPVGYMVTVNNIDDLADNWMPCEGQELDKVEYHELYSIIGDTYGSTAETFNLPNQNACSINIDASLIPKYYYIMRVK